MGTYDSLTPYQKRAVSRWLKRQYAPCYKARVNFRFKDPNGIPIVEIKTVGTGWLFVGYHSSVWTDYKAETKGN